ncbi:hypothetical protein [Streptomyces genisteinicus]|uniref:Uncharacterized protein n=1 Tax=Streptomyces genisteinicus TaxID=2768068 RepID=A0A7H0HPG9_9ACTN|nr:hypothetical protein [Streptomyces genisteinicus]QNP62435.1 hypothetical protein IAG43_05450 [Streptomyces genisteinicus]
MNGRVPGEPPAGHETGCLRWVLGVPLFLLELTAAFCCWAALTVRPSYPGDAGALAGIAAACLVAVVAAAPALLIALTRSARLAFGRWPAVPPVVFLLIASGRLATL